MDVADWIRTQFERGVVVTRRFFKYFHIAQGQGVSIASHVATEMSAGLEQVQALFFSRPMQCIKSNAAPVALADAISVRNWNRSLSEAVIRQIYESKGSKTWNFIENRCKLNLDLIILLKFVFNNK